MRRRPSLRAAAASAAVAVTAAALLAGPAAPPLTAQEPARKTRTARILQGARMQVGVTTIYDNRYAKIPYPGGDVPIERGVCCDVIVRAYRHAGLDLQRLVHEDMASDFRAYPRLWGLSHPDTNIDHRRVPNLAAFFTRHGRRLAVSDRPGDYQPADIVTWRLWTGATHIGLVSERMEDGRPLCVHNVGYGTKLEDVLFAYTITGHFRYDP